MDAETRAVIERLVELLEYEGSKLTQQFGDGPCNDSLEAITAARTLLDAQPVDKPVAWMRKWAADGETPAKQRNENGRLAWPKKFCLLAVTPGKCLPDDVPLFLWPAQPAGKDAWLVEAERLAQLHACEKSLRHLGREDADETKTLAALLAHLRSHPAEAQLEAEVALRKAMEKI